MVTGRGPDLFFPSSFLDYLSSNTLFSFLFEKSHSQIPFFLLFSIFTFTTPFLPLDGFSYDTFTFLLFCSTQLRLLNYFLLLILCWRFTDLKTVRWVPQETILRLFYHLIVCHFSRTEAKLLLGCQ